ncbi:MAG: hypothetical protein RR888_07375 [Akkermansia sp.]
MNTNWNWISSKWWKFDFHSHTPASDDYGKGVKQSAYRDISPADWLLNYMKKGIDCVAVTDHNSGTWIDSLTHALQDLKSKKHPDYRPLYLFPGVEISVHGGIHVLGIFDTNKTTADIDHLLGMINYNGLKGSSNACTESVASRVVDTITKLGGLAIPAHVDQVRGIFHEFSGSTLDQVLNNKNIIAMEVVDLIQKKPALYTDKKLNWSEVLGTDSHHPEGSEGECFPGSRFTWVKMSTPSCDGLRLALIDGALSLKRSDQYMEDPNTYGPMVIENIVVDNAKYLGKGQSFSCQLNPWLNTIIGGRGTGKSTALEFLRIALERTHEIPQSLKEEFSKYSQKSNNRQDEGLLTSSSLIRIEIRKDGAHFRVTRSEIDDTCIIEEEEEPGHWCVSEGDIAQRFPVRIYSQKQIFELAKHPQALLRIIDDSPTVNYREWKIVWDELLSRFLSICAQGRAVKAGIQEESTIKGQLQDTKRKLGVFEQSGYSAILKNYQLRQNQKNAINSWENLCRKTEERIRYLSKELLLPDLDLQFFDSDKGEDNELLIAIKGVRSSFEKIQEDINTIVEQLEDVNKKWNQTRLDLDISKQIVKSDQDYSNLRERLTEADAGTPAAYSYLVKQRQDFEEKLKGFNKKREILEQHKQDAINCLQEIKEHRVRITKLRKEFLEATLAQNPYVQIEVIPYGNKVAVEEELRNLIDRNNGGFDRDIGVVDGNEGILSMLYQVNGKSMEEKIKELKSLLCAISKNDEAAMENVKDRRFATHIQSLQPEQMDRIRCWFPSDSLDVKFSLKEGRGFKPVEQGSPGQKTAALLAFILSYGNEPLILDQPEDDLDNNLIYDLIVSQLREIKQRRQILIVTHNANIVVNGDAENVITLDIKSGQTRIVTQGGLQDFSIRNEICRIMEGGKEAFEQRYKRINAGQ